MNADNDFKRIDLNGLEWWTFFLVLGAFIAMMAMCSAQQQPPLPPVGSRYQHRWDSARQMDVPMPAPSLGGPTLREAIGIPPTKPEPDVEDGDDPRDTPPPVFFGEEIDSESDSAIVVIDDSGSMRGERCYKAVAEAMRFIKSLSKNYRFSVMKFNCGSDVWRDKVVEATDENKASAINWLSGIRGLGGTGTGPAVERALMMDRSNLHIILLTDGAPGCGSPAYKAAGRNGQTTAAFYYMGLDQHRRMIEEANEQGASIDVFGIQAIGQWRGWCMSVAGDSGGSYVDVP